MKTKRKKRDFFELNAISVERLLRDNYGICQKASFGSKKYRIKHSEILNLDNFILVPLAFAYRYKELVTTGKILIVRDGYGFLKAYLNPKIVAKSCVLEELEMLLSEFLEDTLDEDLENDFAKNNLIYQIEDLQENIRLINLFHGEEALEESQGLYAASKGERKLELKRVVSRKDL